MMPQRAFLLMSCLIPLCVACDPDKKVDDSSSIIIPPPSIITDVRMVDANQLKLEVRVDNEPVEMFLVGDGNFSGNLTLRAGNSYNVVVSWFENVEGDLLLAQVSKRVSIASDDTGATIPIRQNEYNTRFDQDLDGRTNLEERREGSNPRDPLDPAPEPVKVNIDVQISIPNSFQAAAVNFEQLTMDANVNNQRLELTRSGLVWTGATLVNQNSDARIGATLFRENERSFRIGDLVVTRNVGAGGAIIIADTDFNFDYDDDIDGLTNLEEIINGFNPQDSDDPSVDPCVPSTFVPDCIFDSDSDGIRDFDEGMDGDEDGDGIPDYLESIITDNDDDIVPAQSDPDEMDPCNPNPNALACDM